VKLIMNAVFEPRGSKPINVPIFEQGGRKWIRGTSVAEALGYKNKTESIRKKSKRNSEHMESLLIKLEHEGSRREGGRLGAPVRFFTLRSAMMLAARDHCQAQRGVDFILFLNKIEDGDGQPAAQPARPAYLDMPLSLLLREWFWGGRNV
jgi:hypothetical protein